MSNFDKIRITWIDDREREYGYPEAVLPTKFQEFFEISHPSTTNEKVHSYTSVEEFSGVLSDFWLKKKKYQNLFPVEIIAVDYNLRKEPGAVSGLEGEKVENYFTSMVMNDFPENSEDEQNFNDNEREVYNQNERNVNFDGLLAGIFYATLTYKHPTALVSITNYMYKMPSEVYTLHTLAEPYLGTKFEQNLPSVKRSWENIIFQGVRQLRCRIEELFKSFDMTMFPSDLIALVDNCNHETLTIRTNFAFRRLPVKGLFIDIPNSEKDELIRNWAKKMLAIVINSEELKQAKELCNLVWNTYSYKSEGLNFTDIVEERKKLSDFFKSNEKDRIEFQNLKSKFKITGGNCGYYIDITVGNYSDRIRRWAAIFIVFNLLKQYLSMKKRFEEHISKKLGEPIHNPEGPILNIDDFYLALFPVPKNPLILPWIDGKKIDKSFGWVRSMMRWKEKMLIKKDVGDLALHLPDLLSGEGWEPNGPHGLKPAERLILQGFAFEYSELNESEWRSYGPSRCVLWGKD